MTNTQQTILGQVSGSEQPQQQQQQEEVQLTELQPVEQSRIKENGDKDAHATDALKALRSFSQDEFESRAGFDFCAGEVEEAGSRYAGRLIDLAPAPRKDCGKIGKRRGKGSSESFDSLRRRPTRAKEGDNEVSVIDSETQTEGRVGRGSGRKRGTRRSSPVGEAEEANAGWADLSGIRTTRGRSREDGRGKRNRRKRNGERAEEKKLRSSNLHRSEETSEDQEEDSLEGLRGRIDIVDSRNGNDCFRDEIYVFRQDQNSRAMSTDESLLEESTAINASEKNHDVYVDMAKNFSETDPFVGQFVCFKNNATLTAANSPAVEEEGSFQSRETTTAEDARDTEKKDPTEEGLRRRIDAIIQANYLLEQENNNVMQRDHNALQEDLRVSHDCNNSSDSKSSAEQPSNYSLKKYCCVICSARFKGSGGLRNHYKVVHAAGPIFTCNECGKEFPLKERLKLHVRTHTGFKPYKCPECDKTFARGGQLVQHRRTHSQVKPYRCVLCSGTFTCAANLALHVKRHNGQKDHKCDICGRGFVRRDALKKHLECLHRDVKSFLCVICNKTFKGHLPQHMRTHAQDRPHGCATCGQRFAQKSQLTVHQRTHSGQRPFRCLVCWQAFAHSTALKLHTRRHTGERPFKCAECNAGFTQLPHWKKHMKCIHGRNEPYCCKKCKSFFRIKNDLESHEKTCLRVEGNDTSADSTSDGAEKVVVDGGVGAATIPTTMTTTTPPTMATTTAGNAAVVPPRYKVMNVEKMRLLLAVLLKRISKPERLDELGFGKRLIDEVLEDSLISAGKDPAKAESLTEFDVLRRNLATFLEWTVPKEHWENFQRMNKTPEEILETLTAT